MLRPYEVRVRIDKTQRGWAIATVIILLLAGVVYAIYAQGGTDAPQGGSVAGLVFAVAGFSCMVFAALLGARKRVPTWRVGRAQAWMRGHLWLGLLSLPLILFHGGFHFGGPLTRLLMWLLIVTVASGLFGAALQHYLPRVMTGDVKLETIYDQISHVRVLLREEADRTVEAVSGPLGFSETASGDAQRAGGFNAVRAIATRGAAGTVVATAQAAEKIVLTEEELERFRKFYLSEVRPFLEHPKSLESRLGDEGKAQNAFTSVRTLLPEATHSVLQDLEDICDEARQLVRQERLHRWLHGWLLLHIPLSLALIVLGAIHAVMALRY